MSTKIYAGFKVKGMKSLDAYQDFSLYVKNSMVAEAKNIWASAVVNQVYSLYDYNYIVNDKKVNFYNQVVTDYVDRLYQALKANERYWLDLSVKLSLSVHDKQVYGIYYIQNNELQDHFCNLDNIVDFSYYDNTDRPDEVTPTAWRKRKCIWDAILHDNTPAQSMLSLNIIDDGPIYLNKNDFVNESDFISFDGRVMQCVNKMVAEDFYARSSTDNVSERIQSYFTFRNTPEHQILVDHYTNIVKQKIDEKMTMVKMMNLPSSD